MFIRSERLFLRPGWPEDWQELLARISDEAVATSLASAPGCPALLQSRAMIDAPQERLLPKLLVTVPGGDGARLIGGVGLGRDGGDVEFDCWIAREHWGQGYATEAARALLGLASALGHRRIVAHGFADRPASRRVLAKVGFRATGSSRERFSRLHGEAVPALGYAIELSPPNDCDGNTRTRRAA